MSKRSVLVSVVVLGFGGSVAFGQNPWIQYNNPGHTSDGHWYRLTNGGAVSWSVAEAEAVTAGGHLVTIDDVDEQNWLNDTFPFSTEGPVAGPPLWIGLYQDTADPNYSEPSGGWKWVEDPSLCTWETGNPTVCYTNWASGEPNEAPPPESNENRAAMHAFAVGLWQDVPIDTPYIGVIERETPPPIPAVSSWGVVIMLVLVIVAGTIVFKRVKLAT